jgi:predicted ATP-dependent endonuclease of OLD family
MIKITKIQIKRFRSINDITLNIDENENIVTICGQNNVGKTNVLRALALFFNKTNFNLKEDIPEYKQLTGGGAVFPNISIAFFDSITNDKFTITKNFDVRKREDESDDDFNISGKKNDIELKEEECKRFLKTINVFYLPSINISFPETIKYLIDDEFLDIEFGNSRMKGKKVKVKDALELAKNTLQEILDELTVSIDPSFKEFHESWGIKFIVPNNINRFREIINSEIDFVLTDDTQTEIHSKGAGLQRLGHILINFRIIEKLVDKRKNCIVLIDEPDIYLHYKLQKKLNEKIKCISSKCPVFVTTHSPIFVNPYNLTNLFLLELNVRQAFSTRKSKEGKILETGLINMESHDSVYLIKETLGIEDNDSFIVGRKNLLVEGGEDKKYIEELINVFELPMLNIISANGVTNFIKLLEYYDAMCDSYADKPMFTVLFDNDEAGREQYDKIFKKVNKNIFVNIDVKCVFIIDSQKTNFPKQKPNIEIEDFMYPEIILNLSNLILKRKSGFKIILERQFQKQVGNISVRYNGVLEIIENLKNQRNPHLGLNFSTKDSGFKGGISNQFNLKGNPKFIQEVKELDKKYPEVKIFLVNLLK